MNKDIQNFSDHFVQEGCDPKKVYCQNCINWDNFWKDCPLCIGNSYKDKNKDLNCKYYKRKWWKFWVK